MSARKVIRIDTAALEIAHKLRLTHRAQTADKRFDDAAATMLRLWHVEHQARRYAHRMPELPMTNWLAEGAA